MSGGLVVRLPFDPGHERLALPDAPADHAPRLDEPLVHVVHAAAINDMVCVYLTMYKWSASGADHH